MKEIKVGKNISDLLEVGDTIEFLNGVDKEVINILNDEMLKKAKERIKKGGLKLNKIDSDIATVRISYKVGD